MPYGVIDLGSNTFNLLVAAISDQGWKELYAERVPVKLLEFSTDGAIQPAPFQRGLEALKTFREKASLYKVSQLLGVATSALRSTTNREDFLIQAQAIIQGDIRVIDGDEEARLIYLGVRQAVDLGNSPQLIVDIGGGSIEFIIANQHTLFWRQSFPVGVARLKQAFHHHEPMASQEINRLLTHLDQALAPLSQAVQQFPVDTLIGSSGSFDSLANILHLRKQGRSLPLDTIGYTFSLEELFQLHAEILKLTLQERLQINGLIPFRADMMVVASLVIFWILDRLPIQGVKSSAYALREGLLAELSSAKD